MKRKSWLPWLMFLILLACSLPTVSLPFFPPTATSTLTATPSPTPYPPVLSAPITSGLVVRNLPYCTNNVPIKMDVYFPVDISRPAPALIYIHGGGWIGGDKDRSLGLADIPALNAAGYFVAAIDYRRPPRYPFPDMIVDAKCAVRFLRAHAAELRLDPNRIGVWGSSAGGHIASLVGLADRGAGWDMGEYSEQSSQAEVVVDMFGPTDLTDPAYRIKADKKGYLLFDVGDPSLSLLASASPINYVTAAAPPFLIIQGDQDKVVAPQQSQLLYQRLLLFGVHAQLLIVQNAGHNLIPVGDMAMIPSRQEITILLVQFFDEVLKNP